MVNTQTTSKSLVDYRFADRVERNKTQITDKKEKFPKWQDGSICSMMSSPQSSDYTAKSFTNNERLLNVRVPWELHGLQPSAPCMHWTSCCWYPQLSSSSFLMVPRKDTVNSETEKNDTYRILCMVAIQFKTFKLNSVSQDQAGFQLGHL